mmetsp:Transcript_12095/g.31047  ORF Transcript_12095/g.31047 Transcript_12095/m.31047 type:complete len:291 (+) Transcript_12095:219-1091(+)
MLGPLHQVVLRIAACYLLPRRVELVGRHMAVLVLVSDLEHFRHRLLGVELAGLPVLHLRELDDAVAVGVQLLEVFLLLLGDLCFPLLRVLRVALPEFLDCELAVAIQVLGLHRVQRDSLKHTLVRLWIEERGELLDVQHAVAAPVRQLELLRLEGLAPHHLLVVLRVRLLAAPGVHVLQELVQAQLPVLVDVHPIKDRANVLPSDDLTHLIREREHLVNGSLAIRVLVHLPMHGADLLRRHRTRLHALHLRVLLHHVGVELGSIAVILLHIVLIILRTRGHDAKHSEGER